MPNGLSLRDERYFYVPCPVLEPQEPRDIQSLARASVVKELPGGVVLEASTSNGATATVLLQLVGSREALRCCVRAQAVPEKARLVLARELAPSPVQVSVSADSVVLEGRRVTVTVALCPFKLEASCGELLLEEDHITEDASDRLVSLPLGYTVLTDGTVAYHESFLAEPDEQFWGLGERFTSFNKRGQLVSCWNHDALGAQSAQSYKNVPFMMSSRGYGCFVDTTTNVQFDCCSSSQSFWSVVVPDEELDYYIVFGNPHDCLFQYQEIVGGPDLPPAWALGVWMSTGFSSFSDHDVVTMVERLGKEDVPCDVLHFDTYWQRYGHWSDLRWDDDRFQDPAALLASVREAGLMPCLWINSYIAPESPAFAEADEAGYFLKRLDGTTYIGKLWGDYHPPVAVLDVTNPEARQWWAASLRRLLLAGAEVFKTDFGEAIPLGTQPDSGLSAERLHNAYSLIYNDLVTAVMRDHGIERPVVWSRSTWAGGQRHVGQWAGDSNSSWQDLASTLRAGMSMALSGHSFWSHDIGGFHGKPDAELYLRWAQFGLLSPMARFHGTTTRLPWDYGADVLRTVRRMIRLRYALHPYLYAAADEYCRNGTPIMRPMVYAAPSDPVAQGADLQYLLGPDFLVAPLYRSGGVRPVWFPPGQWVHYQSSEVVEGGWRDIALATEVAPLWIRAGSSFLLTRPGSRIGDGRYEELVLVLVATGSSATPSGRLAVPSYGELVVTVEPKPTYGVSVTVPPGLPRTTVVVLGDQAVVGDVEMNGEVVAVVRANSLYDLLEHLDARRGIA